MIIPTPDNILKIGLNAILTSRFLQALSIFIQSLLSCFMHDVLDRKREIPREKGTKTARISLPIAALIYNYE